MARAELVAPARAEEGADLSSRHQGPKPLALVVFLENVGHISGFTLPNWMMRVIDFSTEEYAKLMLRVYGVYRCYDRVIILEDAQANGRALGAALLDASRTHIVDVLLLVHGQNGRLVGYRGEELVGAETFDALLAERRRNPAALDLRMVYGVNCYGATLGPTWLDLGARVANGAVGINWFPEPSLSVFLRNWLKGQPYSDAVNRSNRSANRVWSRLLRSTPANTHPWILSSRQVIIGRHDITVDDREAAEG